MQEVLASAQRRRLEEEKKITEGGMKVVEGGSVMEMINFTRSLPLAYALILDELECPQCFRSSLMRNDSFHCYSWDIIFLGQLFTQ